MLLYLLFPESSLALPWRKVLSARAIGLLLLGLSASALQSGLAWGQDSDASPVGKVLTVAGAVHIDHPAAIVVQANLPADAGQAKTGDFFFRGDRMLRDRETIT